MGACLCKAKKRSLERSSFIGNNNTTSSNANNNHRRHRYVNSSEADYNGSQVRHRNHRHVNLTDGSPTSSSVSALSSSMSSRSIRSGRRLLQSISSIASSTTPSLSLLTNKSRSVNGTSSSTSSSTTSSSTSTSSTLQSLTCQNPSGMHSIPQNDFSSNNNNLTELPLNIPSKLSVQVDKLVVDFLCSIRTLFESNQDHPNAMAKLHMISETEIGWYVVIDSLINRIDIDHPLGPALILLVLEDAPLPTRSSLAKLDNVLRLASSQDKTQNLARQRNICLVLSCLAEKLAGALSLALFSERIQTFLLERLDPSYSPIVILFALIALEKFAQTIDNKQLIIKRLLGSINQNQLDNKFKNRCSRNFDRDSLWNDDSTEGNECRKNHLLELETWISHSDYLKKQVGFCAQWGLDNYFLHPSRPYTYETIDTSNINAMLNCKDVSEYLKISPDGLMARNDTSFFESVRCTFAIRKVENGSDDLENFAPIRKKDDSVFYYEVKLVTSGVMQLGFATKDSRFLNHEGFGIGDDDQSLAFDGCRQLLWFNAQSIPVKLPRWQPGDIVGCLIDLNHRQITFSLNGSTIPPCGELFKDKQSNIEYYAAASFMSFQQCEFNFGSKPFEYPPTSIEYYSFNECGHLAPADKLIIPRHLSLRTKSVNSSVSDSDAALHQQFACTICCDERATITLEPCKHDGFCLRCANLLKDCPLCRETIRSKVQTSTSDLEIIDRPLTRNSYNSTNTSSQLSAPTIKT